MELPEVAVSKLLSELVAVMTTFETTLLFESVTTTSKLALVPRIKADGPDKVRRVPVMGRVSVLLTVPDEAVMTATRLLRLAPAEMVAEAEPDASVVEVIADRVPELVLKLTGTLGSALLFVSFTKARTTTPSPPVPTLVLPAMSSIDVGNDPDVLLTTFKIAARETPFALAVMVMSRLV